MSTVEPAQAQQQQQQQQQQPEQPATQQQQQQAAACGALDPASAAELAARYKALWTDYRLAVTGLYFTDRPLSQLVDSGGGGGAGPPPQLFDWSPAPEAAGGLEGVRAAEDAPLVRFLKAPRLDPQLAAYLKD